MGGYAALDDLLKWKAEDLPQKQCRMVEWRAGIAIRTIASIFSDKKLRFTWSRDNTEGCTLEVWIEPTSPNYVTTILAFSTERDPLQFRLVQLENSLEVSRQVADNAGRIRRPLLVALLGGFPISLTVEVVQCFLPLRDSGTTDLIANAGRTLVGALLFRIETLQKGVRRLASKRLAGS